MFRSFHRNIIAAHIIATSLALFYAWKISQTSYLSTGLQFITPLVIIMAVHLTWLALGRDLRAGFSQVVYLRSAQSAIGLATAIFLASIVAPAPAYADSEIAQTILMVVFCAAIIAAVMGVLAVIGYILAKLIKAIFRATRPNSNDPESHFFDVGSLVVASVALGVLSLEGLPNTYGFAASHQSTATYHINASPAQVWQTMEQATQPSFPLPIILSSFPQPVDVLIDEGTALGATRKVAFQGREGAGFLTLQVTERTDTKAVFQVISDTTPYAVWVEYKTLTYVVWPENDGTRLSVSLDFDRRLAPGWFFTPMTKGASYLAMDVLARDVKSRAENSGG